MLCSPADTSFPSDLKQFHKLIDTVTFRVDHRNLSKANVDGLGLLNHREVGPRGARYIDSTVDYAELSIHYASQTPGETFDITKSIIHCEHSVRRPVLRDTVLTQRLDQ